MPFFVVVLDALGPVGLWLTLMKNEHPSCFFFFILEAKPDTRRGCNSIETTEMVHVFDRPSTCCGIALLCHCVTRAKKQMESTKSDREDTADV